MRRLIRFEAVGPQQPARGPAGAPPWTIAAIAAVAVMAAACGGRKAEASAENFARATVAYLEKRGALCVGKETWPIVVTELEVQRRSRNALQLPVLEKHGLVSSSEEVMEVASEDAPRGPQKVRRYRLTETGNRYFLERGPHGARDFCAARLSLDRVVSWELAGGAKDARQATVTYTYRVDAFPWTGDPEIREVFPAVDRVIRGAGSAELKETFTLTHDGWVANELLDAHP